MNATQWDSSCYPKLETRSLLGHELAFGVRYERKVDSPAGGQLVATQRVTCERCGESWPGAGFVLTKCAPADAGSTP